MACLAEKGRNLAAYRAMRAADDPARAHRLIADLLPPALASVLEPADLELLRVRLLRLPESPPPARLGASDWVGALGVFLLVFLSTLPVALPFVFAHHAPLAMRLSNAVAIAMLFVSGLAYGRCVGRSPWGFGIAMVALGLVLVSLTIALGG
jgi:VIT1/CCC1 family predicted Fe2+/Mn2+ transporter